MAWKSEGCIEENIFDCKPECSFSLWHANDCRWSLRWGKLYSSDSHIYIYKILKKLISVKDYKCGYFYIVIGHQQHFVLRRGSQSFSSRWETGDHWKHEKVINVLNTTRKLLLLFGIYLFYMYYLNNISITF